MARPLAKTLKVGGSVEIKDRLYINADNGKVTVSIVYATALHPETKIDFIIALDVTYPKHKATAYVERTRIGRPKTK